MIRTLVRIREKKRLLLFRIRIFIGARKHHLMCAHRRLENRWSCSFSRVLFSNDPSCHLNNSIVSAGLVVGSSRGSLRKRWLWLAQRTSLVGLERGPWWGITGVAGRLVGGVASSDCDGRPSPVQGASVVE